MIHFRVFFYLSHLEEDKNEAGPHKVGISRRSREVVKDALISGEFSVRSETQFFTGELNFTCLGGMICVYKRLKLQPPERRKGFSELTYQADSPGAEIQEAAQQVKSSEPMHLTEEDLKESRGQSSQRCLWLERRWAGG